MNPVLEKYFFRLKENSTRDGLKYFIYDRNNEIDLPFSVHFRFICKDGFEKDSWGTGRSKDEAFGKALMEMIERIYFNNFSPFFYQNSAFFKKINCSIYEIARKNQVPLNILHPANTNGIAIHTQKSSALIAAKLELIERHTILYSLAKGIGPKFKKNIKVSSQKEAGFFIYPGPCKTYTAIGSLTENNGTYFSSGCDFSLEGALLKARLELNSFIYLKENNCNESSKIVPNDIQSFNRYHRYSGDKSAINFFRVSNFKPLPELDEKKFFHTFLPSPVLFHGLDELFCARVIHPDTQQLFFDHWNFEYLNPRIFSVHDELPNFPHIIA